jgi:hypothetical protein
MFVKKVAQWMFVNKVAESSEVQQDGPAVRHAPQPTAQTCAYIASDGLRQDILILLLTAAGSE